MQIQDVTKEYVLDLIAKNDKAVARAILALYARQTADEQSDETTRVSNGRGFNHVDAPFLSSVAKALPKWNNHMTERQLKTARKMLPKYWRQLIEIAQEKLAERAPVDEALPHIPVERTQPSALYGRF